MKIVNIEAGVFESMLDRFEVFAGRVDHLCGQGRDKNLQEWLDNQDVCQILDISKRTLQTYHEKDLLPFSLIRHKILYRPDDVEKLLLSSHHPNE